eukprot:2750772-Lingulodinium_polyedra.AAC.1
MKPKKGSVVTELPVGDCLYAMPSTSGIRWASLGDSLEVLEHYAVSAAKLYNKEDDGTFNIYKRSIKDN